ncbi:MAG: hypothetical protein ACKVOB_09670 [Sphingomonas sp.]
MTAAVPTRHKRSPAIRLVLLIVGTLLVVVSPFVGIIPGPGGIPVFILGLALMLKNSAWARRVFVRAAKRWPRIGQIADIGLRRQSAKRRKAREAANAARPPVSTQQG